MHSQSLPPSKSIFIFSPEKWGAMKLSKHHYALTLAANGHKVYFFEPAATTPVAFQQIAVSDNLYVINYTLQARGRDKLPSFLYRMLVKKEVRWLLQQINVTPDIVWCFDAERLNRLTSFKKAIKVFHPVDFFNEKFLKSKPHFDIAFSTMQRQVSSLQQMGYPAHFINHGLSHAFVPFAQQRLTSAHEPAVQPTTVKIGYVGNLLSEPPDRAMMRAIIDQYSQVEFHFWGQYEPKGSNLFNYIVPEVLAFVAYLKQMPNVTLHGAAETNQLAQAMQTMDMFWICWDITRPGSMWNKDTNPHKIIEYLSTGKPVVTHYMQHYTGTALLYMTQDVDNSSYPSVFEKAVQAATKGEPAELVQQRLRFALDNTYQKQIEQIFSLLPQQTSC